jgi:low temperature requirement protein LtrA
MGENVLLQFLMIIIINAQLIIIIVKKNVVYNDSLKLIVVMVFAVVYMITIKNIYVTQQIIIAKQNANVKDVINYALMFIHTLIKYVNAKIGLKILYTIPVKKESVILDMQMDVK